MLFMIKWKTTNLKNINSHSKEGNFHFTTSLNEHFLLVEKFLIQLLQFLNFAHIFKYINNENLWIEKLSDGKTCRMFFRAKSNLKHHLPGL